MTEGTKNSACTIPLLIVLGLSDVAKASAEAVADQNHQRRAIFDGGRARVPRQLWR